MLSIAHRGYSERYPENSHEAFAAAVAIGADYIETDLRVTRDGAIVCFHDPDLQRRAGRPDAIADTDLATLRNLTFADGGRIVTLDEVLATAAAGRAGIVFDIKVGTPVLHRRIVDAVTRAGLTDRVVYGARTIADCRDLAQRKGCRNVLAFTPKGASAADFAAAGATIVRLWEEDANADSVAEIILAECRPWVTCGRRGQGEEAGHCTAARVARLASMGVGAVILNDPTLVAANAEKGAVSA